MENRVIKLQTDNAIVAEFMGMVLDTVEHEEGTDHSWSNCPKGQYWAFDTPPFFDRSWDWLMPVVEKIESLGYYSNIIKNTEDGRHYCTLRTQTCRTIAYTSPGNSKIESVYKAVVEFIKWYTDGE